MNEAGCYPLRIRLHPDRQSSAQQLLEQDADLEFRQSCADAAMYAVPEGEMASGVRPVHDQPVGVVSEHPLVPVGSV